MDPDEPLSFNVQVLDPIWSRYEFFLSLGQRRGQAMYLAWYDFHPKIVRRIATTGPDCFYDDNQMAAFIRECIQALERQM